MEKIAFIVEKTNTGYSAYAENFPVYTVGSNIAEIRSNAKEAINLYCHEQNLKIVNEEKLMFKIDLPQFFEFYEEINAKALSRRIKMNESLLSQYINGQKVPSQKQLKRILIGIRELGRELTEIDFIL